MCRRSSFLVLLVLILVLRSAVGQGAPTGPDLAKALVALKDRIEKRRVELHIPGLSLAIVQGDSVVFAEGFGVRDVDRQLPATSETLFAIGSATKAFTTALAAMLEQDGVLGLDDKVTKYLPDFRLKDEKAQKNATIRDLLCHRTGLARTDMVWGSGKASAQQILDAVATAEPQSPFRSAFHYNNVMFLAAGLAESAAAKLPWADLLHQRILDPLGMKRTNTSIEAMQKDANAALGYAWVEDKREWRRLPMRSAAAIAPAGCINSSADEMTRWLRLLLNDGSFDGKERIPLDRLEELWTPQIDVGGGVKYGLGWMLQNWHGHRVVEHGGNIDGFAAEVGLLPDDGLGFVLLANVSATPLQQESLGIVWEALLPGEIPMEQGALSRQELAAYEGQYHFDAWTKEMTALVKDEKLCLDVPDQTVYELRWPGKDGKWVFRQTDTIAVRFERDEKGRVYGLTMFQAGLELFMPKDGAGQPSEPNAIPAESLAEYCGRYRFEPNNEDWTVLAKNGRLRLDVPKQMVFTLKWPDADGRFVVAETATMSLFFHRGEDGAVDAIEWNQTRFKPIELKKTAAATATSLPSVAQLMKLRADVGGGAKWADLETVRMTGTVRFLQQGVSGTASVLLRGFDRSCSNLDFGVFGFIRHGFEHDRAWSETSGSPLEEKTGDDAKKETRQGIAANYQDMRTLFAKVEVLSLEKIGDEEAAVVKATPREGSPTTQYLSLKTGLPLKVIMPTTAGELGSVPTTITYADWRQVEGVWIPYREVAENDLIGRIEVAYDEIDARVTVPDAAFAPGAKSR